MDTPDELEATDRPAEPMVSLREIVLPIYLPWFAMAVGTGVLTLALPLYLLDQNVSVTAIAVVFGAGGVGAFFGAIPMAVIVARMGEIRAFAISLALVGISIMAVAASSEPVILAALQFATVFCATGMRLAALSFVTLNVRLRTRGKALANIGGLRRVGAFIGPVIGGLLVDRVGFAWTFVIAGALSLLGILPALRHERSTSSGAGVVVQRAPVFSTIRSHWRRLLAVSAGPLLITTARRGRSILLPLIAASLGVSATATGIIVAIGTGADMLLFPVSGYIMDRWGRLFSIFPAFSIMAIGLVMLGLADSTLGVVVAGGVIGVGNGLSAGSLMTLGSDLAPKESPSLFLAAFSTLQDFGQIIGPILVGIIADSLGLGASAIALAVVLAFGLGLIVLTIGETATEESLPAQSNRTAGRS